MSARIEESSSLKVNNLEAFNYICSFIYDTNNINKNNEAIEPNLVFDVNKFLNDNGFIKTLNKHDISNVSVSLNEKEMELYFDTYNYWYPEYEFIALILSRKFTELEIEYVSDSRDEDNESVHIVKSLIKGEKVIKQKIKRWYDNGEEEGCFTTIKTNDPDEMENIEGIYTELLRTNNLVKNK